MPIDYLEKYELKCNSILESKKVMKPENITSEEWQSKRIDEFNFSKKHVEVLLKKESMRAIQEAEKNGIVSIHKDLAIIRDRKINEFIANNYPKD